CKNKMGNKRPWEIRHDFCTEREHGYQSLKYDFGRNVGLPANSVRSDVPAAQAGMLVSDHGELKEQAFVDYRY
ncbi:hypothetical protein TNCV_2019701, partial [Trichonephila clavipes]